MTQRNGRDGPIYLRWTVPGIASSVRWDPPRPRGAGNHAIGAHVDDLLPKTATHTFPGITVKAPAGAVDLPAAGVPAGVLGANRRPVAITQAATE